MTERTRLRRKPARAVDDRAATYAIIDEALVAHVGFVHEGYPVVIPTGFVRVADRLIFHGASQGRLMTALSSGSEVCVAVTILDGLVLSRTPFSHSMNYRSVVLFGTCTPVTSREAKTRALRLYVERLIPGRWDATRPPDPAELDATSVVTMSISEISAKVRSGGPNDKERDLAYDTWAGVIPLELTPRAPVQDPAQAARPIPSHVGQWHPARRGGAASDG